MTIQNKNSFQWGVILTLSMTIVGMAAAYGAKAERLDSVVLTSNQQSERISRLEAKLEIMAGDLREIKTILRNSQPNHP
jgi:hypothetical protein